jgi:hypothetical protein
MDSGDKEFLATLNETELSNADSTQRDDLLAKLKAITDLQEFTSRLSDLLGQSLRYNECVWLLYHCIRCASPDLYVVHLFMWGPLARALFVTCRGERCSYTLGIIATSGERTIKISSGIDMREPFPLQCLLPHLLECKQIEAMGVLLDAEYREQFTKYERAKAKYYETLNALPGQSDIDPLTFSSETVGAGTWSYPTAEMTNEKVDSIHGKAMNFEESARVLRLECYRLLEAWKVRARIYKCATALYKIERDAKTAAAVSTPASAAGATDALALELPAGVASAEVVTPAETAPVEAASTGAPQHDELLAAALAELGAVVARLSAMVTKL